MKNRRFRTALVGMTAGFLVAAGYAAADVDYPDFSSTEGLQLNGSATQPTDYLRLTTALSNQAGSAFTTKRVVRPDESFKTSFSFTLANAEPPRALPRRGDGPPPVFRGADGMAFVIQSGEAEQLGGFGGDLGYGGIRKSIAVEFDLHANEWDPSDNHIGIVKQGKVETHLAAADPPFDLYEAGAARFAWVNYSAEKKRLKAWVSETDAKPATPTVSVRVNLERVLEQRARAGFTASTGADYETADVSFWNLQQ